MKAGGIGRFLRAASGALLRLFARALLIPVRGIERLADRIDPRLSWPVGPNGRSPPASPPREWDPRLWDRTGGRTANEARD
ncbi:hypothetical protein [Methylobacterium iners]|uniref:Uncharacterized protein n=1 Tax=Methylobacterium iners TaxID=418707 RepID=A0ABQ4RTH9_9HYPH|nr:hypothetical protein [Methylobacterium iners]GJD92892.1 hypothetical protein OCOJLMKI_0075 [Methylobacterium iners]